MVLKVKEIYKNKVEPTTLVETNDKDELMRILKDAVDSIYDENSELSGLFISN